MCMLFSVCCSATSPSSTGSRRSILREVNDNVKSGAADHPDYAVELNATNFDAVLKDTPATFAVVEFFAHWLVMLICFYSLHYLIWALKSSFFSKK